MKLSVIIPFWYGTPHKYLMLKTCIESLGKDPDEVLVIGNLDAGLPWSLNKGMRAASGDFILIVSDDMILTRGNILDLCIEGVVTHPLINSQPQIFGGCVCYPREVYESVGDYDINFSKGYYDDDDYFVRVDKAGYERWVLNSINMYHDDPGHTLRQLVSDEDFERNKKYFYSKWGEECITPLPRLI